MILGDLLDLVNKEKRKKERLKAAHNFALKMGVVAAVGVAVKIRFALKLRKDTENTLEAKAVK